MLVYKSHHEYRLRGSHLPETLGRFWILKPSKAQGERYRLNTGVFYPKATYESSRSPQLSKETAKVGLLPPSGKKMSLL